MLTNQLGSLVVTAVAVRQPPATPASFVTRDVSSYAHAPLSKVAWSAMCVAACSNCSRDLAAFLEAAGAVVVLFFLSWRLAPAVSILIVVTAVAAAMYRRSTRPVEAAQSAALQRMAGVAY